MVRLNRPVAVVGAAVAVAVLVCASCSDASDPAPVTTQTEVGGLEMGYETWRARCTEGEEAFTPQLWHVPELNVLVKDYFGQPETITMLETLEGT